MTTDNRELNELIDLRGETPTLVASQDANHDAAELYRFEDGTEIIVTNAGLVCEDDEGFAETKASILA